MMLKDDRLSSYVFDLPPQLVAQHPAAKRDRSRLLHLLPDGGEEDGVFADLPGLLSPGDLLIRNNARVIPARLLGRRDGGGAAELLLVRKEERDGGEAWFCLARPANRFKPGRDMAFGGALIATVLENNGSGGVWVRFPLRDAEFMRELELRGQVPLPPYIHRPRREPTSEDSERYQTTYAKHPGAVAAPTAGLHFTPEVDAGLSERGVEIAELTLNVGPGTFRPIKEEMLDNHRMDAEWYDIPESTWRMAEAAKKRGSRVVAVGTTSARALEAAAMGGGLCGWTDIFIRPGHAFRVVDGLLTNFHLPGSSLLVMISALAGRERVLEAYRRAVAKQYRFYSYGDAMLVWRPEKDA